MLFMLLLIVMLNNCNLCMSGAETKIVSEFKETGQINPVFNALIQASGKMVLIDKLLTKLKESGHKVKCHCKCILVKYNALLYRF